MICFCDPESENKSHSLSSLCYNVPYTYTYMAIIWQCSLYGEESTNQNVKMHVNCTLGTRHLKQPVRIPKDTC